MNELPSTLPGAPARGPTLPQDAVDTFPNPNPGRDFTIRMDLPEFTCLCPLTGQPDFAQFQLEYVPDAKCVELKSLKLYLWSFRDRGAGRVRLAVGDDGEYANILPGQDGGAGAGRIAQRELETLLDRGALGWQSLGDGDGRRALRRHGRGGGTKQFRGIRLSGGARSLDQQCAPRRGIRNTVARHGGR